MCDMDLVESGFNSSLHLTPKGCKKGEVRQESQQACEENLLLAPWLINTEP